MIRFPLATCIAALAAAPHVAHAALDMQLVSNFSANAFGGFSAGEIVSYDPGTKKLFVTSSGAGVHRINAFDVANPASPVALGSADFSSAFGGPNTMLGLSSVKVDPLGRFGVAALIPAANTTAAGKVGYFNLQTGAIIGTVDVGFHPDSVAFSADGSTLVVTNEGEFNPASDTNAPGSVSVIDVAGIPSGGAGVTGRAPTTYDFSAGNLAAGVTLSGLRNNQAAVVGTSGNFNAAVPDFATPEANIVDALEPEFGTVANGKVFVSLQEANAVAELDLATGKWTNITSLGTIAQRIDASDQDGGFNVDDVVKGLPMPDTLATYTVSGKTYVVTANEGDARVDDRDVSRFGDIAGADSMNPLLDDNYPQTATGPRASAALGRLSVSRIDGDTDGDGKIDDIRMLGTRSVSVWEQTASGLVLVGDTGSLFEDKIKEIDLGGIVDSRSDDKGPEPEALALGTIDGRTYAFVGMERNHGIFMLDVSDPANPVFVDYLRIAMAGDTPLRPEGMEFVPASLSPNGQNLLIVGFEGDGSLATSERVAIISIVPEPSVAALLGLGTLALARRRRHA